MYKYPRIVISTEKEINDDFYCTDKVYGFSLDSNTDIGVIRVNIYMDKIARVERYVVEIHEDCQHFLAFTKRSLNEIHSKCGVNSNYVKYSFDPEINCVITIEPLHSILDDSEKFIDEIKNHYVKLAMNYCEKNVTSEG